MSENDATAVSAGDQILTRLSEYLGANYTAGQLSDDADLLTVQSRFNQRTISEGLRRQKNLEAVLHAAVQAADTPSDGQVDPDWLGRFISHAERVSNEDLQKIWGFLLACEFENPGSVSLSSLSCLSHMTASDMDLWERIGRMTYPDGYVFKVGGRNRLERFGVGAGDILNLQTIGLLQEAQDLSINFLAETGGLTFPFKGASIILRHPDLQLFTFPAFKLSTAGMQLFDLLIETPVDENYLRAFGAELRPKGYDYRLRLGDGSLVE